MEWLAQNWLWILFAVAFFGMHLFGHGGHGGHGGGHGDRRDDRESTDRGEDQPRARHQH
jgi:hypothetical protein